MSWHNKSKYKFRRNHFLQLESKNINKTLSKSTFSLVAVTMVYGASIQLFFGCSLFSAKVCLHRKANICILLCSRDTFGNYRNTTTNICRQCFGKCDLCFPQTQIFYSKK